MTFFSFSSSYWTFILAVIYALTIILLVVSIAFFTVLERKVLAAVQRRRGPNMVGFWGLLQALADGSKLLMKEPVFVSGANYYIFLFAPIFLLTMSLTLWVFVPLPGFVFGVSTSYSFVVVFLFSGLNSFAIILAGIASNSRYSLIGGVRAIAQLISYEIPLSVTLLTLFCIQGSYNLHAFAGSKIIFAAVAFPSLVIFGISLLAETNRTPFDLPEAEAELVAGYNLEYSSILFSLFFLAEYSNILLASSLMSLLFFNGAWFYLGVIFFCLLTIMVRAILPRYTFAQLINLCWKTLFPCSVILLLFTITFIHLLNLHTADLIRPDVMANLEDMLASAPSAGKRIDFLDFYVDNGGNHFENIHKSSIFFPLILVRLMPYAPMVERREVLFAQYVSHELSTSFKIVLFFIVAFLIVCALVAINWILVNFKANNRKNSPYECGFEPVGSPVCDFTPNFTAVALIFLIYDVEVLLTFPWAYSTAGHNMAALTVFFYFVGLMLLGLAYEVLDDSFNVV